MNAAEQWAKQAVAAWREASRADTDVVAGFERRVRALFLKAQLDAVSQAVRTCRQVANEAKPVARVGADRCVDALSNLAIGISTTQGVG